MDKFIPKSIPEDGWQPVVQQRDHAVLCGPEDHVFFRLGPGHGMCIEVVSSPSGRVINALDFESGEATLLGKLPDEWKVVMGRTSDCTIKLMHAIVSRQHVELTFKGNGILVVRDLGSTNGTFLLKKIPHFDIVEYSESHSVEKAQESTMDSIHEAFGPALDDFLKTYAQSKGN